MKMFLFNRKQKVKKWLVDRNFIEVKMTEQINTANKLVFSVPFKGRLSPSLFFAAIPQPRGKGYLLFKIIQEQVQSDRVQYTCIEAAYDELKSYHYIKDVRPNKRSAEEMMLLALEGTRWKSGTIYDAGTATTNFYYISTLEAIQKIATLFGLEATFEVTLDPRSHQITKRLVNLYAQQGERTGKRFEYGSNLLTVEREESSENLITALIGRGKGEEVYHDENGKKITDDFKDNKSENTATESTDGKTPDGYGRRINFGKVVWSKKNGNPVDKPAGQEYVEDPDATALYGFDDGSPRIGIEIFEDITDPAELLQATWDALQTLKRPKVSFKASATDVGDLGLGDTVAIIRHDIGIEYFTRVYKVVHNLLNEKMNSIELGDDFSSQSITSTVNSISGAVKQANDNANHAAISADGKNTNFYGPDKPAFPSEGDLWYKDLGNGEVDLYQYINGNWVLITSTRDLHNVQKQVDKQIDDMKKYEEANKQRDEEINQSIIDTKNDLESAKKDANNTRSRLENIAKQAQNNANGITDLHASVGQIQATVADTQGNVSQLTQKANKTELDIEDTAKRLNQLELTANGLKQTTTSQSGDINQFRVDLSGLKDSVSDNSGKLSSLQLSLNSINSIVSSKADMSYVDQKANEWNVTVKKVDDLSKMNDIKVVNSAINANDYTTTGHYFVKSTYSTNVPDTSWFYFDVSKVDDTRVTQTWQADNDPSKKYSRTYDEGKWSDWQMTITDTSLLGQINITAGTTLVKNKRIFMDASSTVFSGVAFIPSAAITELSADKITTGTLNAGNVNIINMNAASITTGSLKGQNLDINLNTGVVTFQHGRIHSFDDEVDINVDQKYISTANYDTRILLKNGELQLTQPNIMDTNNDDWYFRLNNSSDGNSYNTALLTGQKAITLSTADGIKGAGAWASTMGSSDFRGVSVASNDPTVIGGGKNGIMLKAGTEMSTKHNIMDPSDGGTIITGSPYILIGAGYGSGWNDNRITIDAEYVHIPTAQRHTTGSAPNLYIANDGAIVRSTSASKYKTDIKRSHSLDYGERLLSLPTATWIDKGQKERYQAGKRHIKPEKFFGMIAEDLADAGLELLVSRGRDGELEGIQYDRIGPALIPVIKNLQDRIEKLEDEINE